MDTISSNAVNVEHVVALFHAPQEAPLDLSIRTHRRPTSTVKQTAAAAGLWQPFADDDRFSPKTPGLLWQPFTSMLPESAAAAAEAAPLLWQPFADDRPCGKLHSIFVCRYSLYLIRIFCPYRILRERSRAPSSWPRISATFFGGCCDEYRQPRRR